MAIVLFAAKCFDGSGDILQAVKIADFIKKLMQSTGYKEPVLLVVPNEQSLSTAQSFASPVNPDICLQTLADFDKDLAQIDCVIEVAYGAGFWREHLGQRIKDENIPCIHMPEYSDGSNQSVLKILGGFDKKNGEAGVIPSSELFVPPEAALEESTKAFAQVSPELKKYLGGGKLSSWSEYQISNDFSYQYSHDRSGYPLLEAGQEVDYTPARIFFEEHITLASQSNNSQDVLCIGEKITTKRKALLACRDKLIQSGYTKISFVNSVNGEQEILYSEPPAVPASNSPKEYRVIYSPKVPYSTMIALPLLTTHIAGVTGDQSLIEAMSAGKLISYECIRHKIAFAKSYLEGVAEKSPDDKRVQRLAAFLIKANYLEDYNKEQVSELLKNKEVADKLKSINQALVSESQYFKTLENMLLFEIKSITLAAQTVEEKKFTPLVQLSKDLLAAVEKNKTDSKSWQTRLNAAQKICAIVDKCKDGTKVPTQNDLFFIKNYVDIIKKNKPSWSERSVIQKILDFLSLGIAPAVRALFFNDRTANKAFDLDKAIPYEPTKGPGK